MKTFAPMRHWRGFSVVELMVSVVVGMLAVMFATRLLVNSEQQKSAAVGGSDSMQNGMLAMFQMNGDAHQAGWGVNDPLVIGCNTNLSDTQGFQLISAKRDAVNITPLAPVVIQNGGQNSDVISMYSGTALSGTGNSMLIDNYGGDNRLAVSQGSVYGFARGDVIVVAPDPADDGVCDVRQISAVDSSGLRIDAGSDFRFNQGAVVGNFLRGRARIFNLGSAERLSFHTWSVTNGRLMLRATDLAGTSQAPQTVIDNVVAIKAQYGFDGRGGLVAGALDERNMQVTNWSAAMLDADGDGQTGGAGDYRRIVALRLAVVARSSVPEKPDAKTGACSATTAPLTIFSTNVPNNVQAVPVQVKLSVAGDTMDWTCYRYRAFETIVPIRNSGWRPL